MDISALAQKILDAARFRLKLDVRGIKNGQRYSNMNF